MISVEEVVVDQDFLAPQPFTVLRSEGQWVAGGFQSTTTPIQTLGPVQQASLREITMLPEADRVGSVRAFWTTFPLYLTRGTAPVPSVTGQLPVEVTSTTFTLEEVPPTGGLQLIKNGLLLELGVDYTLIGAVVTLVVALVQDDVLWAQWPSTALVGDAASDIIEWPSASGEQYRIMSVYRDPGGGYWKALGTRMNAA
jgi:hypothetical protein